MSINYIKPREKLRTLEKTKKRYLNKSRYIKAVIRDGKRYCAWCGEKVIAKKRKYCSVNCRESSDIWSNPGSKKTLLYLLERQDFKCEDCGYSYQYVIDKIIDWCCKYKGKKVSYEQCKDNIMYRITTQAEGDRVPEIDHKIAICNGGSGIGIDNVRIICRECHKSKTKKDYPKEVKI